MASSYTAPDVTVEQIQRTRSTPRVAPQLPVVVVGPAVQIETRAVGGTYESGEELQARLPDLADGAIVDPDTVELLLEASDEDGRALGTFPLELGTDAELLADNETFRVFSTLLLEYSILSARNNNQADSLTDDDRATGTPNGIEFTDLDIDFLGRGAELNDNTFIVIDSPASMAGRYKITDFLPTGSSVFTVRVIKVDDAGVAELEKETIIDASSLPAGRTIYGFDTDHARAGAEDGTFGNSLSSAANNSVLSSEGIGVKEILDLDGAGTTSITGSNLTDLLALVGGGPVPIDIPERTSADAVFFTPNDPGNPATLTGINTPIWVSLFSVIEVGDWVRFEGAYRGGGGTELRDYKIIAIDDQNYQIQLQNSDLASSGTFDLDPTTDAGVTDIKFLRVVRGRQDQANAAGDFYVGEAQSIPFAVEILTATPSYITLADDLPPLSGAVNTEGDIIRGITFRNSDASYDLVKQISEGFSGPVLASYQAQRTDLSLEGLQDIGDQVDIESKLGVIHPDNKLAMMADMVTRSGLTSGNRVFFALATDGDTLADFTAALDTLETEDVYHIVPASQDKAVLDAYASHVITQSEPRNKHERVLLGSTALPIFDAIIPAADNDPVPQGDITTVDPDILALTIGDTNLGIIKPGHQIKILASADVNATVIDTQRVKDVNAGTGEITTLEPFAAEAQGTGVYYKVDTYPYTKTQQAELWRDEARGFASSRVMLVRPSEIQITYTDKTSTQPANLNIRVPMYYGCAVYAGLSSARQPQAPLTNVPVRGINRVYNSQDYFTPDQLDIIAEGGNNILTQQSKNTAPASRHQLTTDMTTLETREWSIVKAVDFAAKFFRNSMRPYIGNHNITNEFLTQLRGISEGIIRSLVEERVMIEGTRLESLRQDPDEPDGVIIEVGLKVPYPVNRIVIKLYI